MCYVCCKELKGWCKSFTRTEGLLSILEAILLVVFFSFFIFLILHFVACPTYPEVITEEPPEIIPEATTSTVVVVTIASRPVTAASRPVTVVVSTTTELSSSSGSTSTLPPDVECTWEPSRQTSAATHYYLEIETRSSRRTETPSSRSTEDEVLTEETLEIFNSTLEPPHDFDDDEFVEPADGEPADDTYKSQIVALVKLKPLGDVTFGCILTKITKFWTLTAASCLESIEEVDSLDSFVMIEQFGEAAASRPRGVADVRVHPQFRGAGGRSRAHDLAALRAHRALRPAAPPRLPALLDYFLVAIGERFHILGYGGFR
uniref:Peptidase S1 domain-containing protein n=1 Tax=Heliothis virescens TaxID=7102 RepID=A0A2A4JVI4_HELVI